MFVLVAVALCGLSCGGDGADLGRVNGTVTLDGKAYPDAQVLFTPEEGRPSTGITDSDGKYELTYIRATKGASVGTHTVRITTIPKTSSDRGDDPPFKETIPEKYNVNTTLSEQVEQGKNTFDFPLESE
jgi:hypothetical protein